MQNHINHNRVTILITGANGMLGQDLKRIFDRQDVYAFDRKELDITVRNDVLKRVAEIHPHIIINAAGYTDVNGAESNQKIAEQVNGAAVGYLAEAAKKENAVLVHFSTDYVFDGENAAGYREDTTELHPLNVYGASKLKGEQLLQEHTKDYYLIRTSWLFGAHGKNFVQTMLDLAYRQSRSNSADPIRVVNDQFGKPTYSWDMAKAVYFLLAEKKPFGTYHMTNEGVTSWYEFARSIFSAYHTYNPTFELPHLVSVTTAEFPTPARRPHYSMLMNTKNIPFRHYASALEDYFHFYTPPQEEKTRQK